MIKNNILLFSLLLIGSCGGDHEEKPTSKVSEVQEHKLSYTIQDATLSFEAFNTHFYDHDSKLYYRTTQRKELAEGWTQAIFWDIAMDAYLRTGSEKALDLVKEIYQGGNKAYSEFNWPDVKRVNDFIYDDMMWWIISLARGYELTQNQEYLQKATSGFDFVWEEAYDTKNGGMDWSWKVKGKNACINYPTVIGAVMLYNITNDDKYLSKAKNVYSWARKNLFESITGRVADHKIGDSLPGFEDYTYNQGTCIGAAVMLYRATGNGSYLRDAKLAADYTKNVMSDSEGILPAEGDWNEQGVLKAVFARYLYMLISDGKQEQYLPWLRYNAATAWANRDPGRNLMFRNYKVACPTGDFQSYEASSAVGIMQVCPPAKN